MEEWPVFHQEKKPDAKPRRKGICPQSCKSKGRRLQQWAAIELKKAFPHLQGNDVRSLSMGASGDDLILSPLALQVLPYNFEMKNVEQFQLWATLQQVMKRYREAQAVGELTLPCIVVKRNHVQPVAIVPVGHYLNLLQAKTTGLYGKLVEMLCAFPLLPTFAQHAPNILVVINESKGLNFWKEWDQVRARSSTPLLAFNRGASDHIAYIAMDFFMFVDLIRARADANK